MRLPVALALAALVLAGCSDELTSGSLIAKNRVLGARIEVEGDATRTWPRPAENVSVRWLVVDPAEAAPLTWGFVVCPLQASERGVDTCGGSPIGVAVQLTPPAPGEDPLPSLSFAVPDAAALGDVETLLVLGAVCANGTPSVDSLESLSPCTGGEDLEQTVVSLTIPVLRDDTPPNHQPGIEEITFLGEPWTYEAPRDAPDSGCAGDPAMPQVTVSEEDQEIGLTPVAGSREDYVATVGDPPMQVDRTESLQVSHFTTAGELDRQFSFVEDEETDITVDWVTPLVEDVPDDGLLVRFHFVVRDGRGGTDWASRALCVVSG